ncbi:prolipoprotein diacylglyceryl transferase [bacterium]|nr:prolipoprotein diacylglyceryl transferase [bacterium]
MYPLLFGTCPTYAISLGIAVVVGSLVAKRAWQRLGLPKASGTSLGLFFVAAGIVGLTGAKADSLLERGGWQGVIWELQNGYRYPGAVIALLSMVPLLAGLGGRLTKSLLDLGDACAGAAGFAMAIVRIGCFFAGCCHGTVTSVAWGVAFPPGSPAWHKQLGSGLLLPDAPAAIPVHPLQLYFALWSLCLALLVWWWAPRRSYSGQVLLVWIGADNLAKGVLESLRDPPAPHLQLMSFALGAVACGALALWGFPGARKLRAVGHERPA